MGIIVAMNGGISMSKSKSIKLDRIPNTSNIRINITKINE